jgi:ectoine hydroxylase-related dioxygenase (phytanoyl-CoA dioxygenase family)
MSRLINWIRHRVRPTPGDEDRVTRVVADDPAIPRTRPIGPDFPDWASDQQVDASLRRRWIDDGFVVFPGVFDDQTIRDYNAIVDKVRREVREGKDSFGFGDRIGLLHQLEPDLLILPAAPRIRNFLRWAFGDEPIVFASLQFEKGTQQEAHIDAMYFWPEPSYSMAGAWIALEDVHRDAGPLFYLPGSHRWPFLHSDDVVRSRPELSCLRKQARAGQLAPDQQQDLMQQIGGAWTHDLMELEAEYGVARVPICPRAGDVVIWHSLLAHGGSPRNDGSLSRKSAVFHFFGRGAALCTFEQFMLHSGQELAQLNSSAPPLHKWRDLEYMRFPHFVTYEEGREIVHPLAVLSMADRDT